MVPSEAFEMKDLYSTNYLQEKKLKYNKEQSVQVSDTTKAL
jgi:hypothetical protein